MKTHSVMKTVQQYANEDESSVIHAFKTIITTRYTEFLFAHIDSLLRNLPALLRIIPKLIENKDCKEHINDFKKYLGDPIFIGSLICMNNVYFYRAKMEKEAQDKTFDPFDYIRIFNSYEKDLTTGLSTPNNIAMQLLDTGILNYEYTYNKKVISYNINFKTIQNYPNYLDKYLKPNQILELAVLIF